MCVHAPVLRLRRFEVGTRGNAPPHVVFPLRQRGRQPGGVISELNLAALRRLGPGIVTIIFAESLGAFVVVTGAVYRRIGSSVLLPLDL